MPADVLLVTAGAIAMDLALGDPRVRWHPVALIGALADRLERAFRAAGACGFLGGGLFAAAVVASVLGVYWSVRCAAGAVTPDLALVVDLGAIWSSLALRSLFDHVRPIAMALDAGDLGRARALLSQVVGRDTAVLDAAGASRAAIECLAESFVDGILAPLCWLGSGWAAALVLDQPPTSSGAALMIVYRTVNTLDSLVGHRTERHLRFGATSARLDDAMNLLPARLSPIPLTLACWLTGLDGRGALRAWWRDRHKHPSPNAGHPESLMAGGLGVRLGGPTVYPEGTVDKEWLGAGGADASPAHVRATARAVAAASALAIAAILALSWLVTPTA